jgi:hypothetical protein
MISAKGRQVFRSRQTVLGGGKGHWTGASRLVINVSSPPSTRHNVTDKTHQLQQWKYQSLLLLKWHSVNDPAPGHDDRISGCILVFDFDIFWILLTKNLPPPPIWTKLIFVIQDSVVNILTGYRTDVKVRFQTGVGIFLFDSACTHRLSCPCSLLSNEHRRLNLSKSVWLCS